MGKEVSDGIASDQKGIGGRDITHSSITVAFAYGGRPER